MAQQLRALADLLKDPGSTPNTPMAAHTCPCSSSWKGSNTLTET